MYLKPLKEAVVYAPCFQAVINFFLKANIIFLNGNKLFKMVINRNDWLGKSKNKSAYRNCPTNIQKCSLGNSFLTTVIRNLFTLAQSTPESTP